MARYKRLHARTRNSLDLVPLTSFLPTEKHSLENTAHLYLLSAPFVSLGGLSPNEKEISKVTLPLKPRFFRKQAGLTNRWQPPSTPSCDLLGISQASKAARVGLNETLMRIISVDTPMSLSEEQEALKATMEARKGSNAYAFKIVPPKPKQRPRIFSRQGDPNEMLFSFTQKITEGMEPDITLQCLDFEWELHRMYFFKSQVLSQLLATAVQNSDLHTEDISPKANKEIRCYYKQHLLSGWKHTNICEQKQITPKVTIALEINDPDVTRFAFAIALKNLYSSEPEVNEEDVLGILASANVLQFPSLFQKCIQVMRSTICTSNVCSYYSAGCKYQQSSLITECERWIEVNLVPQLGSQIHLRKLPLELLQKVLKSSRLFTFNEFHLLRTALCWVFLQQNPKIQIIPSYDTVLTYFSSLPKICAFLEREVGQQYIAIFQSLRLHGITSSKHLEELWGINFLPLPWLTRILSDHYHALENGGDMTFQRDFNTQAVRFGLVLTQEPRYHAEVISIYGFFFEIKAVRHDASAYSFYMQRVKHADPIISFFTAERSPVSLKQEREVKYEIKAQCQIDGKWEEFTTERLTQKFGVKRPTCKSTVLKASIPSVPIYVTFSLLFPSS
ncbi:BTB/POZ domain-containing protein 16 isoform X2 [Sceloporus undulatus]|uniref:BTB/POZ domain-containing protein 16 isoform X2 n=1 Tax=Sceloporus undulatus TaxID=8520 RepID=UPI001C4B4A39|nr:BTB/POZ domain-containing protein 16 isoform X2 [Sceloporus undulatus]